MRAQLFIAGLLALILVLARPGNAEEITGEFELLVADDFRTGEHHYEAYIHQEETGLRFKLDIGSLGDMLGRIQTGKSGRIKFETPSSRPPQSTQQHDQRDIIDPDNTSKGTIHATNVEVVRKSAFSVGL